MNKVPLILIWLLIIGCQKKNPDFEQIYNDVYNYISQDSNSTISKMANKGQIILVDTLESIQAAYINYPNCNQDFFNEEDINFMFKENSSQFKYELHNDPANKIFLLSPDSLRMRLMKYPFKNVFFNISKPLFSKDHKHVLVAIDFNCPECGLGKLLIFKKIGKKWKIEKVCQTWIS